jgi:hypothetical protein
LTIRSFSGAEALLEAGRKARPMNRMPWKPREAIMAKLVELFSGL